MLPMLENEEVDLLTSAVKTPGKLEKFDFSDKPIGISGTIMTVKAGNKKYLPQDYKNWNGIRVGILRGNSKNDPFAQMAKEKGFTYVTHEYEVTADLCSALQNGEVDAIVTGSLRRPANEWTYEYFDILPFYVIVKKGNSALLHLINKPNPLTVIDQILKTICSHMNTSYCHLVKIGVSQVNPSMISGVCVSEVSSQDKTSFFTLHKESISCLPDNEFYQKLLRHEAIFIPDLLSSPPSGISGGYLTVADKIHLKAILVAGIWKDKQLWGYIAIVYQDHNSYISEKDTSFLKSVSHLIELMLEREQAPEEYPWALWSKPKMQIRLKVTRIASISHEIRTPLNSILGFSELREGRLSGYCYPQ